MYTKNLFIKTHGFVNNFEPENIYYVRVILQEKRSPVYLKQQRLVKKN